MKIYNNNPEFGDGGPFEFDGDDFDAACEAFADEMTDAFRTWARVSLNSIQEQDEIADDAAFEAAEIESMRDAFIAGLSEIE